MDKTETAIGLRHFLTDLESQKDDLNKKLGEVTESILTISATLEILEKQFTPLSSEVKPLAQFPREEQDVPNEKRYRQTKSTDKERIEKNRIAKHNWYLAHKSALDARRKEKQQARKQMAPEIFGKEFEAAVQTEKPLPMHILKKHEPKLNYFGDGE